MTQLIDIIINDDEPPITRDGKYVANQTAPNLTSAKAT
jgi:hypothetical protein